MVEVLGGGRSLRLGARPLRERARASARSRASRNCSMSLKTSRTPAPSIARTRSLRASGTRATIGVPGCRCWSARTRSRLSPPRTSVQTRQTSGARARAPRTLARRGRRGRPGSAPAPRPQRWRARVSPRCRAERPSRRSATRSRNSTVPWRETGSFCPAVWSRERRPQTVRLNQAGPPAAPPSAGVRRGRRSGGRGRGT